MSSRKLLRLEILEDRTVPTTITGLGTLGGATSYANGINASGQVVGGAVTASGDEDAFIYANGVMTDLGSLEGLGSNGEAINTAGQAVGGSTLPPNNHHAFLYSSGSMTDLGTLGDDYPYSYAYGINAADQIVGISINSSGLPQAFLDANGSMIGLGTLGGGASSAAYGINAAGQVVGYAETTSGQNHAFLYTNGVMTDLGTLGGTGSVAYAINTSGEVAGESYIAAGYQNAFLYVNGVMKNLGTLGGSSSFASGINDAGQVVGWADTASNAQDAFLYNNGVMTNLNTLLPLHSGWTLTAATGINNAGQIVGYGVYNGETLAFLLNLRALTTATLTSTLTPSVFGQSVTITSTVAEKAPAISTPTGSVSFYDGSTLLGSGTLANGIATFSISSLAVGSHSLTADYGGDALDNPSTSAIYSQAVNQDAVNVSINTGPSPAAYGTAISLTAMVASASPGAGTPTGSVSFYDTIGNSAPALLGTTRISAGGATFTSSVLDVGSHSISATYSGDSNFSGGTSSAANQVITGTAPTVSSVVINPGQGTFGTSSYLGDSRVLSIQVVFSEAVDPTALQSAFSLTRVGLPNGQPGDNATIGVITVSTSTNVATLTFSGANTEGGSLADGNWTLNINAADVAYGGLPMAADYTQTGILRLYGDYDGTRTVDSTDLGVLGTTFGLTSTSPAFLGAFDNEANGQIDSNDLSRFGANFGLTI